VIVAVPSDSNRRAVNLPAVSTSRTFRSLDSNVTLVNLLAVDPKSANLAKSELLRVNPAA
jgi:hypothetical protein